MENKYDRLAKIAKENDYEGILRMLRTGLDPNHEGGWLLRLAARHGSYDVVNTLLQFGANPQSTDQAGASTLQLAVYSGQHWEQGRWGALLSSADSSQLADGAAVAVVFGHQAALRQILRTGRCNTNLPTTLTGRTLDSLAKAYNMEHILREVSTPITTSSPRNSTPDRILPVIAQTSRSLSPSVAQFFEQTARLSPQHLSAQLSPQHLSARLNPQHLTARLSPHLAPRPTPGLFSPTFTMTK